MPRGPENDDDAQPPCFGWHEVGDTMPILSHVLLEAKKGQLVVVGDGPRSRRLLSEAAESGEEKPETKLGFVENSAIVRRPGVVGAAGSARDAARGARQSPRGGTGIPGVLARLYSDFSMFTRNERLTSDAKAFFDALEARTEPVLVTMRSGVAMRELVVERLREEANVGGHAILKFNHLTDPTLLLAIDACAQAGARVDLVARTTLTQITPAVHARSIVGRFLEHARVVAFRRGGAWEVWCGSFDAMPRNFEHRYELMFPVEDPRAKELVLRELRSQLHDDVNAYELRADGSETARWSGTHDCQRLEPHDRFPPRSTPLAEARRRDGGEERAKPTASAAEHVGDGARPTDGDEISAPSSA